MDELKEGELPRWRTERPLNSDTPTWPHHYAIRWGPTVILALLILLVTMSNCEESPTLCPPHHLSPRVTILVKRSPDLNIKGIYENMMKGEHLPPPAQQAAIAQSLGAPLPVPPSQVVVPTAAQQAATLKAGFQKAADNEKAREVAAAAKKAADEAKCRAETGRGCCHSLGCKLKHFFSKIGNGIKHAAQAVAGVAKKAVKAVGDGFKAAGKAIKSAAQKAVSSVKKGFQKFGGIIKKGAQKAWKGIKTAGKAVGKFASKYGAKIVHGLAVAGDYALKGIAAVANKIPIFGAPIAMAAKAEDIAVAAVAAGTKHGFGSFKKDTKAYFKNELKHGGFAADVAGIAAEAIPGGNEVGMAAKAATMAVNYGLKATKTVGVATQTTLVNKGKPDNGKSNQAPSSQAPRNNAPPNRVPPNNSRFPPSRAPTNRPPPSKAPTIQGSTNRASTSRISAGRAPTSKAPTGQAPKNRVPTIRAPTNQPPPAQGKTDKKKNGKRRRR